MPRAGFSWQPGSSTAVRGGYGLYYDSLGPNRISVNQLGYSRVTSLVPSLDNGQTFIATLANPFPPGGAISPNPGITIVEHNIRNSASHQWNFTLERELVANFGMRVSYVGNHTTHLPFYNYNVNLPAQQLGLLGQALRRAQELFRSAAGLARSLCHAMFAETGPA